LGGKRFAILMIEFDCLLDDSASFLKHLLLIISMTPAIEQTDALST